MLSKGDCRFIGSIVSLEDGTARVQKVHNDKINSGLGVDGSCNKSPKNG